MFQAFLWFANEGRSMEILLTENIKCRAGLLAKAGLLVWFASMAGLLVKEGAMRWQSATCQPQPTT